VVPAARGAKLVTPAIIASLAYVRSTDKTWWAAWLGRHTVEKIATVTKGKLRGYRTPS